MSESNMSESNMSESNMSESNIEIEPIKTSVLKSIIKKKTSSRTKKDNLDNISNIDNLDDIIDETIKTNTNTKTKLDTKHDTKSSIDDTILSKKYQKMSQYDHIWALGDTYIGSSTKETGSLWMFDNETNNIINKDIEYVPGFRNINEEILINAFDNMNRVNQKNITNTANGNKERLKKVSYIKVSVDILSGQLSVENDGEGIDIAIHPTEKVYIPQMIFGELLTSGNYNMEEEKITGGKNGYGAKLTNIFSTYFKIETVDWHRKLIYSQEYRDNMKTKGEPTVSSYKGEPFTRITYIPDYKKFNMTGMNENIYNLIKKRTIDMFACSRGQLDIYFNDIKVDLKSFTDYMKLYLEPEHLTVSCKPNDRWEIGACMSPTFAFQHVSFVNGINTHQGGKHVDYIVKQITKKMVDLINRKHKSDVKESFIKDNLMVFVNATIVNPAFDSQTKGALNTLPKNFGSECIVPDAFIDKLAESGIMERALALSDFRDSQVLKKTDGKKKERVLDIPKLVDAQLAGTKKANQCTLILTEGDSAKAMAVAGISVIPNGYDLYGVYPLKGKMLNTRDKEDINIAQNKEICDIKKILALQEGEEYKDTLKLRYGRIMLMTDSDVDGSHIKGLVINFLSKWSSLMKLTGFVTSLLTPIVKVWKKGAKNGKLNATSFYTLSAYNEWNDSHNGGKGYEVKYYKGLGSSTPLEGKEYFKNFKIVTYNWDDLASASVDMAFSKERADDRKAWLSDYNSDCILDINQSSVSITDFINKDLIHFSNYDNHRSIPSVFDGLKPSLRKIMYCAFKRNLKSEIKVAQLAGYVSEHGAYHHGEASLNGAIVNLAQNYIGTNNINLLMPEGQFGSRLEGGKDSAAPRYIFTYLSKITNILFNKDDTPLLKQNTDDGEVIEPVFYMPVLPIILINGTTGIGTGWSSHIPQFNPADIVSNIRNLMNNHPVEAMVPWYRGFTGSIKKLSDNKWLSKGRYKIIIHNAKEGIIEINELPIGLWTSDFKGILDMYEKGYKTDIQPTTDKKIKSSKPGSKAGIKNGGSGKGSGSGKGIGSTSSRLPRWTEFADKDGKLIKNYKNESSEANIKFTITFESEILHQLLSNVDKNDLSEFEKLFHLTSPISCCNTMNLYDEHNRLKNYTKIEDILQYYYTQRLHYYELRRCNIIKNLENDLFLLSTKARFILDVINDIVKVRNIPKADIVKSLETFKYPKMVSNVGLVELINMTISQQNDTSYGSYDFLISMPIYNLTKEKVEDLLKEKEKYTLELLVLKRKTDKDLWEEDLQLFEGEYKKHMDEYCDYMSINPKDLNIGKTAKLEGKKPVIKKKLML